MMGFRQNVLSKLCASKRSGGLGRGGQPPPFANTMHHVFDKECMAYNRFCKHSARIMRLKKTVQFRMGAGLQKMRGVANKLITSKKCVFNLLSLFFEQLVKHDGFVRPPLQTRCSRDGVQTKCSFKLLCV